MPVIIQYLLKLSVSAAVIYAFYYLVLRRLTFYSLNRWYLSGYTLLCFIIPFINITQIANRADEKLPALSYIPAVQNIRNYIPSALNETGRHTYNIWNAVLALLAIGSVILLVKLLVQMTSFMRMKRKAKLISDKDSTIYHVDEHIMPFSFGRSIYLNKNMHNDRELGEIIMHEYVHVKQMHSADILLAELFCVLNWYNPFAWFIRHSIRQNLEFIADDNVVRSGIDKKAYQYHLLKVVGIPQYRLANQFNFSSLKKRIIMMNRQRSAKINLLKFMFILPLLAVTLMAFRSEIVNTVTRIASRPGNVRTGGILPVPAGTLNTTLTGRPKKLPILQSTLKEIKRPDTTIRKSMNVTAYFKGEVLRTMRVNDSYLVIVRDSDRFDSYSNLTSIAVKKGDKIKKGQFLGTVDVDTITGIPELKYSMYNGTTMVYDADGSDTSKRPYAVALGYGKSYNKTYVITTDKKSRRGKTTTTTTSTPSADDQVYVAYSPATNYSGPSPRPNVYVAGRVNVEVDSAIRVSRNKAMVVSGYAVYNDNVGDPICFTIDPRHMDESQFSRMEKEFADNGFKLKISNGSKLRIQVSGSRDNSTSSATAVFSGDDLNSGSMIRITGDKKTGLVSITTYPNR